MDLDKPELFINRELSWLEFNDRVLRQGMDDEAPLMERLKFLSIVSSNLDEFFMVRVAGLKQQAAAGVRAPDVAGLTASEQLARISERVHRMVAEQSAAIRAARAALAGHDIRLTDVQSLDPPQRAFVEEYFSAEVLPVLTPMAVDELRPFPLLPGLGVNLGARLAGRNGDEHETGIVVIPVPGVLPRFVQVPAEQGLLLIPLEEVIAAHIGRLFPGEQVEAATVFRLTRDADMPVNEDEVKDLLQAMEEVVLARRRRAVVRLELAAGTDAALRSWLMNWCAVEEPDVYEIEGLIDARPLMNIASRPGFDALKYEAWPPCHVPELADEQIWDVLQSRDLLMIHPYDSFDPVVHLIESAADDPSVLAIKQTLYRVSDDSPIIRALERAAQNGKQVTVLIELKARFDEAENVTHARRLEDAGCFVIYGVAGLKTHAKLLLIVRREPHGIRRYVHVGTGNYNERTAKLYSDIGLITADADFARDASAFFNLLTGSSQEVGWSQFAISPTGMRERIIELIEREKDASTLDQPGLIMAKMNSLHDAEICKALYRAAAAGVRIRLNVRGICRLRPGIEGVSDNIEVTSIVDRFLEHARVFAFRNAGHEEVYLSSADWMTRNMDSRMELCAPVLQSDLQRRLIRFLEICFEDNVKAYRLLPDGTYERVRRAGPAVRAQETLYREAAERVESSAAMQGAFRPITSP